MPFIPHNPEDVEGLNVDSPERNAGTTIPLTMLKPDEQNDEWNNMNAAIPDIRKGP